MGGPQAARCADRAGRVRASLTDSSPPDPSQDPSRREALAQRKRALRRELEARRRASHEEGPAERATRAGEAVAAHVAELPAWREGATVALYAALEGELPSRPLFERARSEGRVCALPRVREDDAALEFAVVERWDELVPGRYGVREPGPAAARVALERIDLLVAPGLAFDADGRRLGRGGGHYDRTLAGLRPDAVVVGVGFAFQLVKAVPAGPHDLRVGYIVTEDGTIDCLGRR